MRRKIFNTDTVFFQHLPEIVNRFLLPPDPVILHYTLNPTIPPPEKSYAWDVEVKVDDSNLKSRMKHVVMSMASDSAKELTKLDEEVRVPSVPLPLSANSVFYPDRTARAVAEQRAHEAAVPARVRGRPAGLHPDVARVAVARPGERAGERAERGRDGAAGGPEAVRVLPAAVGRGGGRDTGRYAASGEGGNMIVVCVLSVARGGV